MQIAMHFYTKISSSHYRITECYRIGVINRQWDISPEVFIDILNPMEEEIFFHDTLFGELPPDHLLKELLSRM